MIETLRNSKACLSALVERAARGEEIVITVRGRPKARLCPLAPAGAASRPGWAKELRAARARWSKGVRDTGASILEESRGDRL